MISVNIFFSKFFVNLIIMKQHYCQYYQSKVNSGKTWFFVAAIRSCENLVFDRTFDVQNGIFEFLVPENFEIEFLKFMNYMESRGIISDLKKLDNRFILS